MCLFSLASCSVVMGKHRKRLTPPESFERNCSDQARRRCACEALQEIQERRLHKMSGGAYKRVNLDLGRWEERRADTRARVISDSANLMLHI